MRPHQSIDASGFKRVRLEPGKAEGADGKSWRQAHHARVTYPRYAPEQDGDGASWDDAVRTVEEG